MKNKQSGIYMLTNTVNGKMYIGQSENLDSRLHCHLGNIVKCDKYKHTLEMYHDMKHAGLNNIKIEILEYCPENQLNNREKYWISYYNSCNVGYNIAKGGGVTREHIQCKWTTWHIMNNGKENKKIEPKEIDKYLADGWKFGEWYKYNN